MRFSHHATAGGSVAVDINMDIRMNTGSRMLAVRLTAGNYGRWRKADGSSAKPACPHSCKLPCKVKRCT